ncbi:hypothetical protein TruAng_000475 [Truncatella angustata]|nr:hypothetical protein TruAng_000475 [Truncatella angustata]
MASITPASSLSVSDGVSETPATPHACRLTSISALTDILDFNDGSNPEIFTADDMILVGSGPMPESGFLVQSNADQTIKLADVATEPVIFTRLSEINNRLQNCNARIENLNSPIKLNLFSSHDSLINLDKGVTLVESLLVIGQSYLNILLELKTTAERPYDLNISAAHNIEAIDLALSSEGSHGEGESSQQQHLDLLTESLFPTTFYTRVLDSSTSLMVIGIYVQLTTLWDLMASLAISEMHGGTSMLDLGPAEGLRFGAYAMDDGPMQALVYIQMVTRLLTQLDRQLGLSPTDELHHQLQNHEALLRPRHIQLLHTELSDDQYQGSKRERLKQSLSITKIIMETCG